MNRTSRCCVYALGGESALVTTTLPYAALENFNWPGPIRSIFLWDTVATRLCVLDAFFVSCGVGQEGLHHLGMLATGGLRRGGPRWKRLLGEMPRMSTALPRAQGRTRRNLPAPDVGVRSSSMAMNQSLPYEEAAPYTAVFPSSLRPRVSAQVANEEYEQLFQDGTDALRDVRPGARGWGADADPEVLSRLFPVRPSASSAAHVYQEAKPEPSYLEAFTIPQSSNTEDVGFSKHLGGEARKAALERLELELERSTYDEAVKGYQEVQDTLFRTGKATQMRPVHKHMLAWYGPMIEATEKLLRRLSEGQWSDLPGAGTYGPFLLLLPPKTLAVIAMHTTVNTLVREGNHGVPLTRVLYQIGAAVQVEVDYLRLMERYGKRVVTSLRENGVLDVKRINRKARKALQDGIWATDLKVQVGGTLLQALMQVAKTEAGDPAFLHQTEAAGGHKKRGTLEMAESVFSKMSGDDELIKRVLVPRFRPMVVPPREWQSFDSGGYRDLKTYVVRTSGGRGQMEAIKGCSMPQVYEALNYLGKVTWTINKDVYTVLKAAWEAGLTIGELPSREDLPLPTHDDGSEEYKQQVRRIRKHNSELYSLRCDTAIKLDLAEQFVEHEFYFPYNLDFRGRAYPVPPNLNHLGSDFCRGILTFSDKKALGPKGLWWLKVHLANLCGQDKLNFQQRVDYIDQHLEQVHDSAARPLDGGGWWQKAEDPWQALAVCMEVSKAIQSGDPEAFLSGLPVHQDGSCNGLQHYAALGRDEQGALQVNLIGSDKPQDVYTGVCDLVVKHVHDQATRALPDNASDDDKEQQRLAKLVDGMIGRKVVKQTVMTSVYGVTYVGARKQIQARLREKWLEDGSCSMLSGEQEEDVYKAAAYVATITLSKLGELFSSARAIMDWLASCASLVARQGQPMAWVTPLGLPVIQPYRRETGAQVKTLVQNVVLVDCHEELPVSSSRQRSAFPPNFVHSLDSTHMLMTTNRLKATGIAFTAVHDSYWCHAGNVELMNRTLRESFVDLYHQPILENLRDSLVRRYPEVDFPPIPERGRLRLEEVLKSPYFFD